MSQRVASKHFDISRTTIQSKLKLKHNGQLGHPTTFTTLEESAFVSHILTVSEHLMLTTRLAANTKRNRAAVNEKTLSEFIENLSQVVTNVPAESIYNYDETNLSDDPGRKKIICRRGCKYPERVINSSKSNISVMFCGNAAGCTIPPYVVYKSKNLWSKWTENGPHGTRNNRTKHGWDNLTSHISQNVLKLCQVNNIVFVCLPPNSSHLTQHLDVAYFRPLKSKWKNVLNSWKESPEGKKSTTLPKGCFPSLLKNVLELIKDTSSENLIPGFAKCGIYPCNNEPLINRLPLQDRSSVDLNLIS
ncbi:uncharacterized protein LOC136089941 [Hydra vulgaris]|uniref:Uncharacterized protein LOC136089941 n=1 Tax=Hydra vulgaris TaxID=6087 RepID=A0ABM4DCH9_HYDVU